MNPFAWLEGYKTKLAAAGLLGLALYQLSQGQYEQAAQSFLAGLAALGIGAKIDRKLPEKNDPFAG